MLSLTIVLPIRKLILLALREFDLYLISLLITPYDLILL